MSVERQRKQLTHVYQLLWLYIGQKPQVGTLPSLPPAHISPQVLQIERQSSIEPDRREEKEKRASSREVSLITTKSPVVETQIDEEKKDSESDIKLREKKKLEKLFPKPYRQQHSSYLEFQETTLQNIEKESGARLSRKISFPKKSLFIKPRWSMVSLLHEETGQDELKNFIDSVKRAIEERLQVSLSLSHSIPIHQVSTLSLADGEIAIFIGEEHHLSSLQHFIRTIPGFNSEVITGYAPALFLGRYFNTISLFISIDREKIHRKSFKQELWHLLQQLQHYA